MHCKQVLFHIWYPDINKHTLSHPRFYAVPFLVGVGNHKSVQAPYMFNASLLAGYIYYGCFCFMASYFFPPENTACGIPIELGLSDILLAHLEFCIPLQKTDNGIWTLVWVWIFIQSILSNGTLSNLSSRCYCFSSIITNTRTCIYCICTTDNQKTVLLLNIIIVLSTNNYIIGSPTVGSSECMGVVPLVAVVFGQHCHHFTDSLVFCKVVY